MNRTLRRRHRRMLFLLALIVPALVAAALWLRRPLPRPTQELTATESAASLVEN